jgi:chitodextrinase
MNKQVLISLALALGMAASASAAFAASADDYKAAYAKAQAVEKQAVQMKTSWTTTVNALKEAKQAGDAGKFDEAVELAGQAEALANASIAQAKEQQEHWREAVIQ